MGAILGGLAGGLNAASRVAQQGQDRRFQQSQLQIQQDRLQLQKDEFQRDIVLENKALARQAILDEKADEKFEIEMEILALQKEKIEHFAAVRRLGLTPKELADNETESAALKLESEELANKLIGANIARQQALTAGNLLENLGQKKRNEVEAVMAEFKEAERKSLFAERELDLADDEFDRLVSLIDSQLLEVNSDEAMKMKADINERRNKARADLDLANEEYRVLTGFDARTGERGDATPIDPRVIETPQERQSSEFNLLGGPSGQSLERTLAGLEPLEAATSLLTGPAAKAQELAGPFVQGVQEKSQRREEFVGTESRIPVDFSGTAESQFQTFLDKGAIEPRTSSEKPGIAEALLPSVEVPGVEPVSPQAFSILRQLLSLSDLFGGRSKGAPQGLPQSRTGLNTLFGGQF